MSAAHGLRGPRRLALNHVVQVSTLRGRACMNVAGCLLANEQLVTIRIARPCWGRSGGKLQVIDFMEIEIFFVAAKVAWTTPLARELDSPSNLTTMKYICRLRSISENSSNSFCWRFFDSATGHTV